MVRGRRNSKAGNERTESGRRMRRLPLRAAVAAGAMIDKLRRGVGLMSFGLECSSFSVAGG
jgi:hypothetical protein